jgi:hypothetical protein
MAVRKLSLDEQKAVKFGRIQDVMFHHARHWGELSRNYYQPEPPGRLLSGRDPIDAFQFGLVANAFRSLGEGQELESVLDKMRREWEEFCVGQEKIVNEAPKIKRGPMAGQSSAHYKWAGPKSIESNIIFVRNMYKSVT